MCSSPKKTSIVENLATAHTTAFYFHYSAYIIIFLFKPVASELNVQLVRKVVVVNLVIESYTFLCSSLRQYFPFELLY